MKFMLAHFTRMSFRKSKYIPCAAFALWTQSYVCERIMDFKRFPQYNGEFDFFETTWVRRVCCSLKSVECCENFASEDTSHTNDNSRSQKCLPVFRLLFYSNPLHAKGMSTSEKCLRVFHLLFYSNPLLAKDILISEKCLRVFCLLFIQNPEHVQHMSISRKSLSVFRLLFIQNPEHAHDMFTPEKCLHVLCLLCYPKSCTCQHCL